MRFDCECVDVVIEYDDKGLIIRVYVETKENSESINNSELSDTK